MLPPDTETSVSLQPASRALMSRTLFSCFDRKGIRHSPSIHAKGVRVKPTAREPGTRTGPP